MSEYHRSTSVKAPAEYVFDFVSRIENLPRYLPTVQGSNTQPGDRVRIYGEVAGEPYDNDGSFVADPGRLRVEWSSDGENVYRGWLNVVGNDEKCEVNVHLSYVPRPHQAQRMKEQLGSVDAAIHNSLEQALQSIRQICEKESKGVPAAETKEGYLG
jgi:uncharacterized membrane protein